MGDEHNRSGASIFGTIDDAAHGMTVPRIFTPPLRELTKDTSLGFSVITFAEKFLGIELYPWQKWLLVHALEILDDGSYRFRRVVTLVARQNGKTLLMSVLAAWWLFIDSKRHPDKVPPLDFQVVGTAQTLDNAKKPYASVKLWCNPKPATEEEARLANPLLQSMTQKISNVNGEEGIICLNKSQYIVRAAKNIRSKSAARVIFDELREQYTEDGWNSVSQTVKAVWSSQLWGISNAGDYRSGTLKRLVDQGRATVATWNSRVNGDGISPADWAEENDASFGFFEWSAPDKCAVDDRDGVRQANPSMGYGAMSYRSIIADVATMSEAAFRTEVLCQWVTADVTPYLQPRLWKAGIDKNSTIPDDGRVVLSVDTSADRETTYISAAGYRADGLPHVELIARRDGMLWVPEYLRMLRDRWPGIHEIAIQGKGCPAVDFIDPLTQDGWTVYLIEGFRLGACTGRFRDRIREAKLRHLPQPVVESQAAVAVTRRLGEVEVWDRTNSALHISAIITESQALYALESMTSEALDTGRKYKSSTGIQIHT